MEDVEMAEYKIQGGFASNDDFVAFLNDKNKNFGAIVFPT